MKFQKFLAGVLAAALLVMGCTVTAGAASISDTATAIKSGNKVNLTLSAIPANYKITVSKSGELKISLASLAENTLVTVYDSNGNNIHASDYVAKTGKISTNPFSGEYYFANCKWNDVVEKFEGTVSYAVSKGTYYILFEKLIGDSSSGKLSFTATFPSSGSSTTKTSPYLTLTVKKGGTVDLGVAAASGSVTWSTSKSSVAAVDQSGKVTAKKSGSAIIKAKTGGKTMKIKIVVK